MMEPARILIVEDEAIIAIGLQELLRSLGHTVIGIAASADRALELAASSNPDLVLMDVKIRGRRDGIDTANELGALHDLPVIFVTAFADEETLVRAREVQPFGYLVKPVRESELRAAVEFSLFRHKAEREIRASKAQFERLVNNIREGLIIDDENGALVYANDEFLKLFGYSRDEIQGLTIQDYVAPEWREMLQDRHMRRMRGEDVPTEFDYEGMRKDGSRLWLSVTVAEVHVDGKRIGTQSAIRDVSMVKATQHELMRREKQLSLVQRMVRLGGWEWDILADKIQWSDEMLNILGLESQQSLDVRLESYMLNVHPEDREGLEAAVQTALASGEGFEHHYRYIRPDGQDIHLYTCVAVTSDEEGRRSRFIGSSQDITELKRAEAERLDLELAIQQVQRLEGLGVLTGGIAHDFNNLLSVILGNFNIVQQSINNDSDLQPYLQEANKAIERAADLTRQMLAYSGRGPTAIRPIDLSDLVREMAHLLDISIWKKIKLQITTPDGLAVLEGNATQIRQVVMNLITNASDAIGDQFGTISVSIAHADVRKEDLSGILMGAKLTAGKYVVLRVEDTGCGMDAQTMKRIFDPFFSTKFTGRGLGLAAVIGIVRGHNGAINVESEPGKGTVFTIWLPAGVEQVRPPKSAKPQEGAWQGSGTVLLVEDDIAVQRMTVRILERLGFSVLTADDGREGLSRYVANQATIRAVILDMTMPVMDGAEMLTELRKMNAMVPVIVTSGYAESDLSARVELLGPTICMEKPYTMAALRSRLEGILSGPSA